MNAISWVPVSLIGVFAAFGWARLLFGMAALKRRNAELKGYADSYGASLERHHGSRTSCEEALAPLRERIGALSAQVSERDAENAKLADELKAALGVIEAASVAATGKLRVVR